MNLHQILPADRIHTRLIDRLAYARDASIYRIVPKAVVRPKDETEVIKLLNYARKTRIPVTFRTAGTSLSGQSVTEGIIAETVRDWKHFEILQSGNAIKLQPGIIGDHANRYLSHLNRKIGPDPASIKSAMIGGIIANNASGMCCGTNFNSYHTLKYIRFVLANGNIYDTSNTEDYDRFVIEDSGLADGLTSLRDSLFQHHKLVEKIRHKYRIKNTLGYSLNALIDFEHPLDIFSHLLIGSEGTLAFISNVTLHTVPDPPFKSTGLIILSSIEQACAIIPFLKEQGADAVELMDYASLTTAKYLDDPPYDPAILSPETTALLCEFQRESETDLQACLTGINKIIVAQGGKTIGGFQSDEKHRMKLWQLRKSLFPTVGSLRKAGTSIITEDVCFDLEHLAQAVKDLKVIFKKWDYHDAVIFGHAKDGNLHFVASIDLESEEGINNYDSMIKDLVEMTVGKFNGSLKAEHGTGRNMAPFVETEWGGDLYRIMWQIKQLADPQNILNPGVLLNNDNRLHIRNLKPMPTVSKEVDLCVECGFCEPICPSKELTLTPRQRIVIARELKSMEIENNPNRYMVMKKFSHSGNATCAVDGLCEITCPVNINTGRFIKDLRYEAHSSISNRLAGWAARHFRFIQALLGFIIWILSWKSRIVGHSFFRRFSTVLNKITYRSIPIWNKRIPGKAPVFSWRTIGEGKQFIYYPTCINRVFSITDGKESLVNILGDIATASGIQLIIPEKIADTCCGIPFSSKGYKDAGKFMTGKTIDLLYAVSQGGEIPVLVDTSPCSFQFLTAGSILSNKLRKKSEALKFVDLIPFLFSVVKDLSKPALDREVILHPTCATQKMNDVFRMKSLAAKCAKKVVLPEDFGCCGFAGDRGLLIPELTASATRMESNNLQTVNKSVKGYSTSRTCEIGMMSATNRTYESIALLVRDYLLND